MAETRNPGLVKEVMGHESLSTTMKYLHPETAQVKSVIDRRNERNQARKTILAATATVTATKTATPVPEAPCRNC